MKRGEVITRNRDREPRTVVADKRVMDDRGCVAVERGPLVYCDESADNNGMKTHQIYIKNNTVFNLIKGYKIRNTEADGKLFSVDALQTVAQELSKNSEGNLTLRNFNLTLIPYYAWNHRGAGRMDVWLKSTDLK